jgi:hypothetical protein
LTHQISLMWWLFWMINGFANILRNCLTVE